MKIVINKEPFEHIIIQDIFSAEERSLIWREADFLFNKLGGPDETNAARETEDGPRKKSGKGVFLDNVYQDRGFSDMLSITRKPFHDEKIVSAVSELASTSPYFKLWSKTNWDSTLFQYYSHGDHYKSHLDESIFTIIHTFYKTPKQFDGGDLFFEEYSYTLPIRCNQTIIFSSQIQHQVNEVVMHSEDTGMDGRFSISNLVCWKN